MSFVYGNLVLNPPVPTSNKPGKLETKLVTVLFPTPAFPKKTFAVNLPSHEPLIIPFMDI